MKITKENNELVIKIPLYQKSYDAGDNYIGDVPNIIAVVDETGNKEHTISYMSDLGYAGKQQEGSPIIDFWYDKEGLLKVAKELGLPIWYK